MTNDAKWKIKTIIVLSILFGSLIVLWVGMFWFRFQSDLEHLKMVVYIGGSLMAVGMLIERFWYIPPDPKDAIRNAKSSLRVVKDQLINIRLRQIKTMFKMPQFKGQGRAYYRYVVNSNRSVLKKMTIDEITEIIKTGTPWVERKLE